MYGEFIVGFIATTMLIRERENGYRTIKMTSFATAGAFFLISITFSLFDSSTPLGYDDWLAAFGISCVLGILYYIILHASKKYDKKIV
jgi:drug/metabolite transporter (DMT)-like permease